MHHPQDGILDNKDHTGSSPLPSLYCSSPLRGSPSYSCSSVGTASPDFSLLAAKNSDLSAFDWVLYFIKDLQFYISDLRLANIDNKTYWKLVAFLEDPQKVGGNIADSVRYNYNRYTEVFTVKCMPTIVHDAILPYYSHQFGKMYKCDFITDAEFDLLSLRSGTDSLLPYHNSRCLKSPEARKGSGVKKQADVSVYYGEGVFPSLVCEVGFTESYIDLLEDARQWLEKSDGRVRLVMIIKLEEEKKSTIKSGAINLIKEEDNARQVPEDDDSERDNQAVEQFGSDPASYEDLRISCKTDDWVGPINGFLELWRYDGVSRQMKQDGSRVTLLPSPTGDTTCIHVLPITKADIKGALSTPEDEKLVFMLDLDNYRERLIKARRELAFTRMICYLKGLRKRKRTRSGDADSDSDFDNEAGEGVKRTHGGDADSDSEFDNEEGEGDKGEEKEVGEGPRKVKHTRRKMARVGGSPPEDQHERV